MKNKKIILSVLCTMVFVFTGCADNTKQGTIFRKIQQEEEQL